MRYEESLGKNEAFENKGNAIIKFNKNDLDFDKALYVGPRAVDAKFGHLVYAPNYKENALVLLGWTGKPLPFDFSRIKNSPNVECEGVLAKSEKGNYFAQHKSNSQGGKEESVEFYWVDLENMVKKVNLNQNEHLKLVNCQTTISDELSTKLNTPMKPHLSPGMHLGYAATWFTLSLAGVVLTRKLIKRTK